MTIPGGLDVLWDDELRTERETAKEPSKRWTNVYFYPSRVDHGDIVLGPGAVRFGTFASADIAETRAHEWLAKFNFQVKLHGIRYDGPEEQPNNT